MSANIQQNHRAVEEKIRNECMALLSNYRPGFKDPVQPERSEILENWSFGATLNREHDLADERLQELKRVLRADREMAKQSNMQAVSDFFDDVASGRCKQEFVEPVRPKRKYAQRKRPAEPTKKRTTRRRKQIEEVEAQEQMMPFNQQQMMWPDQGFCNIQPMSFNHLQMQPPMSAPYAFQPMPYSEKKSSDNACSSSPVNAQPSPPRSDLKTPSPMPQCGELKIGGYTLRPIGMIEEPIDDDEDLGTDDNDSFTDDLDNWINGFNL